jgi:hypothetical protein
MSYRMIVIGAIPRIPSSFYSEAESRQIRLMDVSMANS